MGGPWAGARPGLRPQCCRGGPGSLRAGRVPAAPSNTGVDGSRGDPEPRHAGLRVTAMASGSLQSSLPKNFNESFTRSWSEAGKTLTERGARPQCRRVSFGSPASWGRLSGAGPRQALGPRPATGEQGRLGAHSVPGTGRHRAHGRVGGEQSGAGSPAAAVHPALLAARPGTTAAAAAATASSEGGGKCARSVRHRARHTVGAQRRPRRGTSSRRAALRHTGVQDAPGCEGVAMTGLSALPWFPL